MVDQRAQSEEEVHDLVKQFLADVLPTERRTAVSLEQLRAHWQKPAPTRDQAKSVVGKLASTALSETRVP